MDRSRQPSQACAAATGGRCASAGAETRLDTGAELGERTARERQARELLRRHPLPHYDSDPAQGERQRSAASTSHFPQKDSRHATACTSQKGPTWRL
jgi:hypothetical protein